MRKLWMAGAGIALAALAGCGTVASSGSALPTAHVTTAVPATSAPAVKTPPAERPDGSYQGACNYTLSDNFSDANAGTATGDIEVTNTGNVGIEVKATITWPQQGYDPLSQTKTVKVPVGGSSDVQFRVPMTMNQVENLQNWQEGHGFKDGCTYSGKIVSTFGVPQ